jgi:hypothetical protein
MCSKVHFSIFPASAGRRNGDVFGFRRDPFAGIELCMNALCPTESS